MSTIDPSSQLLAQVRAQALAYRRQVQARGAGAERAEEQQRPPAETPRDWPALVARAVVAIDPDDPQRQRKAFRVYLEAVLAQECEIRSVNDPGFQELVDRVHRAMEADRRLRGAMASAGEMLLRTAAV